VIGEPQRKSDLIQVIVTFGNQDIAWHLARKAVERRLAACVQSIAPIRSFFRWNGELHEKQEWQCHFKTVVDRFADLEDFILTHYPAETPEITAIPIVAGNLDYCDWIRAETQRPEA
jgi:periplasmic divalent cation tolerance protein